MTENAPIVFLRGKMTTLCPLEKTDAPILQTWFNDPDVRVYMNNLFPITRHDEEKWLGEERRNEQAPNDIVFGIKTAEHGLIGTMGLHCISWTNRTAVSGTCIGSKDCWGKGYGTDAKMILLKYAFDTLNLRKINSHILDFNGRSQAFNKKCGYVEVGRLKDEIFRDGRYCDEVTLSVLRDDWAPLWEKYCTDWQDVPHS